MNQIVEKTVYRIIGSQQAIYILEIKEGQIIFGLIDDTTKKLDMITKTGQVVPDILKIDLELSMHFILNPPTSQEMNELYNNAILRERL